MKVRIIADSTADMMPNLKSEITTVPLTVHFDNEEYIDGVTITHKMFYEKLVETDVLPHTSQASPASFEKVFADVSTAGEGAVVLTISSKLSGTYQSAMIAAQEYDNIYVVDSTTAAIGTGILAELAIRLKSKGMDAKAIAQALEAEKKNLRVIAMLDTLEYLKKGGRISKTAAFAGGVLNIKPVVSIDDGEIKMLGKARGSKHGNNLLVTEIEKTGGVNFDMPILLGYTGLTDVLLQKYIEDSKALWVHSKSQLNTTIIGSVIGTHAGPGAVAVAFFKK